MRDETGVPVPPQDDSKPGNGLPNPDLNPMMNPTLGKNLGLWAQVYFTSPPEKREEAVQQLLRDLEKGVKPQQIDGADSPSGAANTPEQKSAEVTQAPVTREGIICPACLHRNDTKQRFCGLCGFTLRSKESKEAAQADPVSAPTPLQAPVERNPDDWGWLHQKNLVELQTSKGSKAPWRLLLTAGAVLMLAVVGYLLWSRRAAGASPATGSSLSQANPVSTTPKIQPSKRPEQSSPPEQNMSANAANSNPPNESETEKTPLAGDSPPNEATAESSPSVETGGKELEMAHRYLDGIALPKDGQAAAFWLWKAVKKNNDEAVLLLSDLYVKGEGVPQSCDQARVLLGAAVKRGSSAAGSKLKEINSSGCR